MPALKIEPITPTIGAEVSGVRLGEELSDDLVDALRNALLDHLVLFFRNQPLSLAEMKRFGASFGSLDQPAPHHRSVGGEESEIHIIDYDGSQPRGSYADVWHADVTCEERPPMASILMPLQLPANGGDTLWANMYAAYDALPEPMKVFLDSLEAEHALPAAGKFVARNDQPIGGVIHPVVRIHPETGKKAIYVNRIFTRRIVGMDVELSDRILSILYWHMTGPEFQMRWRWEPDSIAIWDNRCTQHYGVVDYHERRMLYRLVVTGDRPIGPTTLGGRDAVLANRAL